MKIDKGIIIDGEVYDHIYNFGGKSARVKLHRGTIPRDRVVKVRGGSYVKRDTKKEEA